MFTKTFLATLLLSCAFMSALHADGYDDPNGTSTSSLGGGASDG